MTAKHAIVTPNKRFWYDAAERVGWTALYGAVTEGILAATPLSYSWAPVLILGLNALKVLLAKKVGDPATASLPSTPAVNDPDPVPAPSV